ncbi:RcpC/CpaB family pilus assembly protein [Streptomyces sp. NPDC058200]|uniref:RcpC/CpaB family pilus assembly protein n=1 Tax=Streptomyces sp. NPDC058200 TaxID=3346378 RepID=UPI0036F1245C
MSRPFADDPSFSPPFTRSPSDPTHSSVSSVSSLSSGPLISSGPSGSSVSSSGPSGSSAPEPRGVPPFDPLRVRGSGQRLRRAVLRRRRAMAAGLAMTAAALAAGGAGGGVGAAADADARAEAAAGAIGAGPPPERQSAQRPARMRLVSAPVRIADAATVRLLRPGDRVDVISAAVPPLGSAGAAESEPEARVVATGVRVAEIPTVDATASDGGALVVLSVPRAVAAALAGASATSRLAVTLC